MTRNQESTGTPKTDDTGPSDLDLRGRPAGLAPPDELARLHPDSAFLIAYSRISDDWRKHNRKKAAASSWAAGKGVANQHRRNDKNAARHGAVIVHRYTDNDLSASKRDVLRPDFQAMLRDLRRGHTPEGHPVHGVICVDQDRVQRTDRDWEDFVDALTLDTSRRFYTPSGPMDLTEESEIIKTGVMAVVNKAEGLKKKRRIRDWHQDRILDGLPHSGPRPFGWEEDRKTLRPAEATFLSWSIRERIKGKAVSTLCAEAKSRGPKGTRGGETVPQTPPGPVSTWTAVVLVVLSVAANSSSTVRCWKSSAVRGGLPPRRDSGAGLRGAAKLLIWVLLSPTWKAVGP